MYRPGGNSTEPIWRVLAFSQRIASWAPLKPQHSNPNALANQLWCSDFPTPSTPLIIPHRLAAFFESLMPLKTHARFMQDGPKAVWTIPYVSVAFFPSLKQNFIAYRSSKVSSRPDSIFEIDQLWQSGFSRLYSNCYCSCWFETEIIKIGQSSHKMYSNKILNSQESTTILNAHTKKAWKLIVCKSSFVLMALLCAAFKRGKILNSNSAEKLTLYHILFVVDGFGRYIVLH